MLTTCHIMNPYTQHASFPYPYLLPLQDAFLGLFKAAWQSEPHRPRRSETGQTAVSRGSARPGRPASRATTESD